MPFWLLYRVSDFICFILYRVVGYRKKVVRENLTIAFPHLSEQERKKVEKKFYTHFCDTFLEMIKTMTISEKEMEKRFTIDNIELVKETIAKGKSIALICAHYSSYEWLLVMNSYVKVAGFGIYKKMKNPYFDKLIKDIRAKFGAKLIPSKEIVEVLKQNQDNGILGYYGFVSDQSPKLRTINHYTLFFGKEVPVFTGAEFLARKYDMNVMFVKGQKIKRGYYKAAFVALKKEPKEYPEYGITDEFLRLLESQILEAPEYYLWTHKRFKHARNTPS